MGKKCWLAVTFNFCLFYDRDRHLWFTLEPSHIWAFSWSIGVGILVVMVWSALYGASDSFSSNTKNLTNFSPTPENDIMSGLRAEHTSSFPFGID